MTTNERTITVAEVLFLPDESLVGARVDDGVSDSELTHRDAWDALHAGECDVLGYPIMVTSSRWAGERKVVAS